MNNFSHPHHSTEKALLKITNDLMMAADSGLLTILILLDPSVAFDATTHNILLKRLASCHISSYLPGHTQFMQFKSHSS